MDSQNNKHCSWNSQRNFLSQYRPLMVKVRNGDQNAYQQIKNLRSMVFHNTVDIATQRHYIKEEGKEMDISEDLIVQRTVFYDKEFTVDNVEPRDSERRDSDTIVEVLHIDCLEAVRLLEKKGYYPALLNMASRQNPGGGVINGAGAQEETIFRRTNLFRSLYQFAPYAPEYGLPINKNQNPLDRNFGGIYSPLVVCFRDDEKRGYKLRENPFVFAVISVAGMNRPPLTPDGKYIAPDYVSGVKNKIRTIFRIGLLNGHDSLVLGALGCGAFCNPPSHVAKLFHEVMEEPEFKNKYAKIVFAIIDDHNAHQKHNPEGNYLPFVREFI